MGQAGSIISLYNARSGYENQFGGIMKKHLALLHISLAVITTLVVTDSVVAQTDVNDLAIARLENGMEVTTRRRADEGDGPHERLILRGATIIDGTGAPPMGPVDIVI